MSDDTPFDAPAICGGTPCCGRDPCVDPDVVKQHGTDLVRNEPRVIDKDTPSGKEPEPTREGQRRRMIIASCGPRAWQTELTFNIARNLIGDADFDSAVVVMLTNANVGISVLVKDVAGPLEELEVQTRSIG